MERVRLPSWNLKAVRCKKILRLVRHYRPQRLRARRDHVHSIRLSVLRYLRALLLNLLSLLLIITAALNISPSNVLSITRYDCFDFRNCSARCLLRLSHSCSGIIVNLLRLLQALIHQNWLDTGAYRHGLLLLQLLPDTSGVVAARGGLQVIICAKQLRRIIALL